MHGTQMRSLDSRGHPYICMYRQELHLLTRTHARAHTKHARARARARTHTLTHTNTYVIGESFGHGLATFSQRVMALQAVEALNNATPPAITRPGSRLRAEI